MSLNAERNLPWPVECYIFHRPDKKEKLPDHDRHNGKGSRVAHERCNLMSSKTYKWHLFFYTFRGYDSHLNVWGLRSVSLLPFNLVGQGIEM